jgi:AAA15 family ATPase/GTPase
MYTNLKISNSKGLKVAELSKLGKINIFCGRNSSGKTSVLEAIVNESMMVGLAFENQNRTELKESYNGVTSLALEFLSESDVECIRDVEASKKIFGEIIDLVTAPEKIYYLDDKTNLLRQLEVDFFKSIRQKTNKPASKNNLSRKILIVGAGLDTKNLEKTFENLFANKTLNYVLLPPKRLVESSEGNNYYVEVQENGDSLLSKIFYMKNQTNDSSANNLYREIH